MTLITTTIGTQATEPTRDELRRRRPRRFAMRAKLARTRRRDLTFTRFCVIHEPTGDEYPSTTARSTPARAPHRRVLLRPVGDRRVPRASARWPVTHEINIKVAPIFTLERFNDPAWTRPGRWMYEGLRFLPGQTTAKLLVNHDAKREIGIVHHLWRWDWVDGPWVVAHAAIDDPPAWLRAAPRASFGSVSFSARAQHRRAPRPTSSPAGSCGKSASSNLAAIPPSPARRSWDSGRYPHGLHRAPARSEPAGEVFYGRRHDPPTRGRPHHRGALIYPMNNPNATPTATASTSATHTRMTSPSIAVGSLSRLPVSLVRTMTAARRMRRKLGQHSPGRDVPLRPVMRARADPQEREPNYSCVQSGSLSPLRAAPLEGWE